ncbi:MAG: adenylate/guanylate cyclase domain-containing protein [Ardenticatenaceae bacterium]
MTSNETANILVVDDTRPNLRLLVNILSENGYKVRPASNGPRALAVAKESLPDLILLDINMPGMSGYEVCEQLKAHEPTRDIPVIFISVLSEVLDKVKGFAVGGVDYITKPFQVEELLARVRTHLTLRNLQSQLQEKNAEITHLNQRLHQLFRQFASKEVADELLAQGFSLGGKHVEATAMFADIRSFTTISESQSAQLTIELLNDYYAHMTEVLDIEGGVVNQIIGDGIMCMFGAPVPEKDHAERAVRTALRMVEQVNIFNEKQAAKGRVQIRIGIGIATGVGVAGYVGTQTRTTYTWVSNASNLAARLDAYTKVLDKPILIDGTTRHALSPQIQVQDQGLVEIRGKAEKVHVFSVPVEQTG